ncbi:MAG: Lrp/AsnC family transcriptional regulator [Nanobdellota archaeon]
MEHIFNMELDDKDHKILEMLVKDSSLSTQKIAKKTLIPITTVHNRIKRLEKGKVIEGYTVIINKKKIGKNIFAFILIRVDSNYLKEKKITQKDLAKKIKRISCVEDISIVTGDYDIIIRIGVKDVDELNELILKKLRNISGIESTKSMIVLDEV